MAQIPLEDLETVITGWRDGDHCSFSQWACGFWPEARLAPKTAKQPTMASCQ
jgi:hypothetical protein